MMVQRPAPARPGCSGLGLVVAVLVLFLVFAGFLAYRAYRPSGGRLANVWAWLRDPSAHLDWTMQAGQRCGIAPFIFPTNGFIGFLWDDSFRLGHRHQGIDIFGGTPGNVTPVIAAYPGYLTRLQDWRSSLIIRIPNDPLQPGRQIWTYYTHMANPDGESFVSPEFPPGTREVYVEAGTLLGYQGNYSGTPGNPVGVHLHFSIVTDDGNGSFRNELEFGNTLDPSPYLGLPLNAKLDPGAVPGCEVK